MNDELQITAYRARPDDHPEQRRRFYLKHLSITTPFSLLFQNDQLLPISNDPVVPITSFGDTIPLRCRSGGPHHHDIRAGESNPLNGNGFYAVDEQIEESEISRKEGEESSSGSTLSSLDIRKENHKNRIKALAEELKPMFLEDGSAVVLLCWGEKYGCSILPVQVSNTEDEVCAWERIHRAWYARRGYWRKYLPGFNVTQVEVVEVCHGITLCYR